ncbi:MAG: hypothetical protein ABIF84_02610 [Patescibacteria group bacterium]
MHQLINGSHRTNDEWYFEWWYFHFVTTTGIAINIVLHETDIFGLSKDPYISMSVYFPKTKPKYYRIVLKNNSIVRNATHLKIAGSLFYETEKELKIILNFSSDVALNGLITKITQPLILNNGLLYKNNYWIVNIPLGIFKGKITIGGQEIALESVVYQDHQWGNITIQEFVSDWVWGHFSSVTNNMMLLFYAISTQDNMQIRRFARISANDVYKSIEAGNISHLVSLSNRQYPERYNGNPIILFPDGSQFSFRIDHSNIMRARTNETHKTFNVSYLRWVSSANIPTFNTSLRIHGITEYIRIRRK